MMRRIAAIFKSWSYSRYGDYKKCPYNARLKHLDKVKEPKSPALENGGKVHKDAEFYIKGAIGRMPASLKNFSDMFRVLKNRFKTGRDILVEASWSFTKDWKICNWDDWDICHLRMKIDVAVRESDELLKIIDWKTGKFRADSVDGYTEQLDLYAVGAMTYFPDLQQVQPQLVYLDAGVIYPEEPKIYYRKDLPELQKAWGKRVKPMLTDTQFAPRPNNLCTFCFFGQSGKTKGGPGLCKF